jgi:VanZ family protein
MLTETFHSITNAARSVIRSWKAMLLIGAVYAALLALLYLFVSIKEATLAQVTFTFVLAVAAPLLFFLLQAMIASDICVGARHAVPLPEQNH